MAQQILKEADGAFRSFFALLQKQKRGEYQGKVRIPKYLPKDGCMTLVIGFVRIKENHLELPYSRAFKKTHSPITITMPPIMAGKKIGEIRIKPLQNARFFEMQYTYEEAAEEVPLDREKAMAIDLGIDNLAACATCDGQSFLIDGRRLKSMNQWYNKENARLQSIKDKQKTPGTTNRQARLVERRNRKVRDYMSKAAKKILWFCLGHKIGNLVIGYQNEFQQKSRMGKKNNQNFVNIPYGYFRKKLEYLCERYGIHFVIQEESYTSQASFFEQEEMPVYGEENEQKFSFRGKRVQRGLYSTGDGMLLNADINGALNILRKSNVVCLTALYRRGAVDTPKRIRIA